MSDKKIEYFVSFCVMTAGANPMGHSFMLISQLDHSQADANIEVINAIGVYSQYMPVLGFKPYAVLNVKLEDMKYIANRAGLKHETYQISKEDVGKLLDIFHQDKLKIAQYHDKTDLKQKNQPVPMFNLLTKQNCKRYVLDAMEQVGIDTSHLSSFMEIPILNSLDIMKISEKAHDESDKSYYWLSPMRFHSKTSTDDILNKDLQKRYNSLYHLYTRSNKLLSIVQSRKTELEKLGKKVREIDSIERDLLRINTEVEILATCPKLIASQDILNLNGKLTNCIRGHINKLEKQNLFSNIVGILKDVLQELILHAKSLFVSIDDTKEKKFNNLDRDVFHQLEASDAGIRGNQHASDMLSDYTYRRARV